jgi:hypothetical protein
MNTRAQNEGLANIPVAALEAESEKFVEPMARQWPEKRLRTVIGLAVRGISGGQAPVVTQMARCLERTKTGVWAMRQRFDGLVSHQRLSHRTRLERALGHCATTGRHRGT